MRWILAIIGGAIGAFVGGLIFDWLLGRSMYAMILPGALLGIGAGLGSRSYSLPLGIVSGLAALGLGVFLEWHYLPLIADESLMYFLQNIRQVDPSHLIMIAGGGFAGFWFGQGRESSNASNPASPAPAGQADAEPDHH